MNLSLFLSHIHLTTVHITGIVSFRTSEKTRKNFRSFKDLADCPGTDLYHFNYGRRSNGKGFNTGKCNRHFLFWDAKKDCVLEKIQLLHTKPHGIKERMNPFPITPIGTLLVL